MSLVPRAGGQAGEKRELWRGASWSLEKEGTLSCLGVKVRRQGVAWWGGGVCVRADTCRCVWGHSESVCVNTGILPAHPCREVRGSKLVKH